MTKLIHEPQEFLENCTHVTPQTLTLAYLRVEVLQGPSPEQDVSSSLQVCQLLSGGVRWRGLVRLRICQCAC